MNNAGELNPYVSPPPSSSQGIKAEPVVDLSDHPDVTHVFHSLCYANEGDEGGITHVDARALCRMVLSLACKLTAYDRSGGEAIEYLKELNICKSEDVGNAISELQLLGLSNPSESDHPSDFDDLFDLNNDAANWLLHFDFAEEVNQYEIIDYDCEAEPQGDVDTG